MEQYSPFQGRYILSWTNGACQIPLHKKDFGISSEVLFIIPQKSDYAFLAISVSWVKAAASLTANSASILRLISTPAVFRPCIKVE